MTRLSKTVLVLAIGAFGTVSGAIANAEDTDKAGDAQAPPAASGEVQFGDGMHGRRPPVTKED